MSYNGSQYRPSQLIGQEVSDLNISPSRNNSWNPNLVPGYLPRGNGFQSSWSLQSSAVYSTPTAPEQAFHNTTTPSVYTPIPPPPPETSEPPRPLGRKGKPKRNRTAFSSQQLLELETVFKKASYVSRADRTNLSSRLGLKDRAIKVWFQNRRMKQKKEVCKSSDEGSPPPPEICSSTTDLPVQHFVNTDCLGDFQFPINHDPHFASLQAQDTFNRSIKEYQEYCRQQQYHQQPERQAFHNSVDTLGTYNHDNMSSLNYYPQPNVDSFQNYQTPLVKLPDSTTPEHDASTILSKIELDLATSKDDSGLVSMNSESLDKLGALVSQCITSDILDISSDDNDVYVKSESPKEDEDVSHGNISDYYIISNANSNHTVQVSSVQSPDDFFKSDPDQISTNFKTEPTEEFSTIYKTDDSATIDNGCIESETGVKVINVSDIPLPADN